MFIDIPPETIEYQITEIDFWEQDATLLVNGQKFYFQFAEIPEGGRLTILDALNYLANEVDNHYRFIMRET